MTEAGDLVTWLRAAGEPTRLRLLALCAQREFSVSELALVVGQSGPRVSRHLKILCAAGLLSRLRCGQWVHYRLAQDPAAARFLRAVVADLDPGDPLLAPDRDRVGSGASAAGDPSRERPQLDQALASFIAASAGEARRGSALIVGVQHMATLASTLRAASDCTAIAYSRRAAQAAGTFLKREGLTCRIIASAPSEEPIGAEMLRLGPHYEAVVLNRLAPHPAPLAAWLAAARQVLAKSGRLWLFERLESLATQPEGAAAQPLARLRRLLDEAGFACERLSPIKAGREQVLAAVAVPAWAVRAANVA
ncbi:MAG TPA: metalloregulator ArsR/SmtB family transcription factor [Steroidobacteraceae bacterium]|jgi:DNA-binding transcriptional ArsR family regulator|nr:metalloregulator ArsR/SmtB family transcription factor [Steroidobacteraceae bacterium]